jgi:hypothetical protein
MLIDRRQDEVRDRKPLDNDSPNTTRSAPVAVASATSTATFSIVAGRSRKTGAACTAAARKRGNPSPVLIVAPDAILRVEVVRGRALLVAQGPGGVMSGASSVRDGYVSPNPVCVAGWLDRWVMESPACGANELVTV